MYTPMLKNHVNGCDGNHTSFHSENKFIFEDKNSLHFWDPNERFGTHKKIVVGCKVDQISYLGTMVFSVNFHVFIIIHEKCK